MGGGFVDILDLVGTASFAISGGLKALHRRPDLVGMTILAGATAIGGGVLRDVILDREVAVLRSWSYPLVILASVLVVCLFPSSLQRRQDFFKYFDAVGLGVFSAIGASLAWDIPEMNILSVLMVAAMTGAGGGIIRDVLMNELPLVLYKEIYITAVIAGAGGLAAVRALGAGEVAGFVVAMVLTTGVRVVAIRLDLSLPRLTARRS